MAYTHTQRNESLAKAAVTSAAAVVARLTVGFQPKILVAVALTSTVTFGGAVTILIKHRPTAGSVTAQVTIGTFNATAVNQAQGKVLYIMDLNRRINPGEEVVLEVTATNATGTFDADALIEESWEMPGNNTRMTLNV